MYWPTLDQYQQAVQHPDALVHHPLLQKVQVEKRTYGIMSVPFARSGNFGAVYKFYNAEQTWAVKVFIREDKERSHRYRLISETASLREIPAFLDFDYRAEAIQINSRQFPLLVMEWGKGKTLNKYFEEKFERGENLDREKLCRNWTQVVLDMQKVGVAHGDLQHGNILVDSDDTITLVDYDGMYVPAMQGMKSMELGLPAYQHPLRDPSYFNSRLDDFAAMVILLQLMVINGKLWSLYHKDDNYLLLNREDLCNLSESRVLADIEKSEDNSMARAKQVARILRYACTHSVHEIPPFAEIVNGDTKLSALMENTEREPAAGAMLPEDALRPEVVTEAKQDLPQNEVLPPSLMGIPPKGVREKNRPKNSEENPKVKKLLRMSSEKKFSESPDPLQPLFPPEQKQQFFNLALARGYLTQDIVKQWGFLSLDEFWHNGYLSEKSYRELLREVLGQEPLPEEIDAADSSEQQIPDSADAPQMSRGPTWQSRMKFTHLDVPAAAVGENKENKEPEKIAPVEPKPVKLSVKALKERRERVKSLKKHLLQADEQEKIKSIQPLEIRTVEKEIDSPEVNKLPSPSSEEKSSQAPGVPQKSPNFSQQSRNWAMVRNFLVHSMQHIKFVRDGYFSQKYYRHLLAILLFIGVMSTTFLLWPTKSPLPDPAYKAPLVLESLPSEGSLNTALAKIQLKNSVLGPAITQRLQKSVWQQGLQSLPQEDIQKALEGYVQGIVFTYPNLRQIMVLMEFQNETYSTAFAGFEEKILQQKDVLYANSLVRSEFRFYPDKKNFISRKTLASQEIVSVIVSVSGKYVLEANFLEGEYTDNELTQYVVDIWAAGTAKK